MAAKSPGMGGYVFPYGDTGSVACLNGSSFCAAGMAAATGYGAGVGVNLNQLPGATGTPPTYPVPASKMGIAYALTAAPPAKTVLIIDNNGVAYQAPVTLASANVPWASFALQTPDAGPPTLTAAPVATHIQFQHTMGASFNFCITSLTFY
ncbi:MAG: hypothetical protein M3O46_05185 [Myxococcota bacterium]|nr:hypothetical protein [Myxococcota bacterium]